MSNSATHTEASQAMPRHRHHHRYSVGVDPEAMCIGAAMTAGRTGGSGEPQSCSSINIYINNNIQGVSNSILFGSSVQMRDPGVWLTLRELKLKGSSEEERVKMKDWLRRNYNLCGSLSCVPFISLLLVIGVGVTCLARVVI